ncbi:MAG: GspH/FimT family pseudopilin [Nitrospirae bacterium]|nr:GspH/FimT family pseudopilin [Nitrospirota bacterium]
MNEQGKSLMEIIIVMAVVVMMTAFTGAGLLAATAKQKGRVVATELANELRAARYLAIMQRDRIRVVLKPGTTTMRVETAETPGRLIREYNFSAQGVTVERLSNGADIVFHPSGRAASPTTITLRNRQQERWQLTISLVGRVSQI